MKKTKNISLTVHTQSNCIMASIRNYTVTTFYAK